jgi:hypothetical protein
MKVYVDAPAYVANSNGLRCLYGLAHELISQGVDIYLLPRDAISFAAFLPSEYSHIPVAKYGGLKLGGVLIAGESLPIGLISQARSHGLKILWWYLAPEDVLDFKPVKPNPCEPVMVFSPYVGPAAEYFYYQPPLDDEWLRRLNLIEEHSSKTSKTLALYSGKGRLKKLPCQLLGFCKDFNITIISRHMPATRKELLDTILFCDGLISFDELSQLNLEAASLRVPVLIANKLYDSKVMEDFPVRINSFVTQDPNVFMSRVLSFATKSNALYLSSHDFLSCNEPTVEKIAQLLSCPPLLDEITYAKQQERLSDFGRRLRARHALLPIWRGQSPGAHFFLALYAWSLHQGRIWHLLVCCLTRSVDFSAQPILSAYKLFRLTFVLGLAKRIILMAIRR